MQPIGKDSLLFIDHEKVTIIIKKSFIENILFVFGSIIIGITFFLLNYYLGEKSINYSIIALGALWLLVLVFNLGFKNTIILQPHTRSLITEKSVYEVCYQSISFTWENNSYFKYKVNYDTYEKITSIWLLACSREKKETYEIIEFPDKETFIDFQKHFNAQFSENKILEWHD